MNFIKRNLPAYLVAVFVFLQALPLAGFASVKENFSKRFLSDYSASVTFPAGFVIGDYIEFLRVNPVDAHASGNYLISISYTRGNLAAAATFQASVSHANPDLWRESGRINNNGYVGDSQNFTVDCNTQYGNPRFRLRAIGTLGVQTEPITVHITVQSININAGFTELNVSGNDLTVNKLLPMTSEWSLYVGNSFVPESAFVAIKALINGNVGIGTATPSEKLSVNGKIRAQEIKVETANWPDYVFKKEYDLPSLSALKSYLDANHHLPEVPSADQVEKEGVSLGEMNAKLLKKIEELTLYLIEKDQQIKDQQQLNQRLIKRLENLE